MILHLAFSEMRKSHLIYETAVTLTKAAITALCSLQVFPDSLGHINNIRIDP